MEENALMPVDYLRILKLRKWSLILPALMIFALSVVVALVLPPVYESSSTILIEEQEIPKEYVATSINIYAEKRLQRIKQRMLSTSNLLELVNKFKLYPLMIKEKKISDVIAHVKESIFLEPISVDVVDRRTGRPATATIAFTIAYHGRDAKSTLEVAKELTSLFLKEDILVRKRQARDTSSFLENEVSRVKSELVGREKKLAAFKELHVKTLPEFFQDNMQAFNAVEQNIASARRDLGSFYERRDYFKTQLIRVEPILDIVEEKRLGELHMKLANFKSGFSDEHPDVKKIKAEIGEVESVIETKKKNQDGKPDNPAYITLSSQLAGVNFDIDSVKKKLEDFEKQRLVYKKRIAASPGVEQEYSLKVAGIENLKLKFNDLQRKVMEAKITQGLQSEEKGERLSLLEPARFPEKPYRPNKPVILLIGLVLGVGIGLGTVSLAELSDHSFRNALSLKRATDFPVLAEIPIIVTQSERVGNLRKNLVLFSIFTGLTVFAVYLLERYVTGFDTLAARILNQML